ncbi:MAG: hypothetical protein ACRD1U_08430 [Vicinamibacterales bacterium]
MRTIFAIAPAALAAGMAVSYAQHAVPVPEQQAAPPASTEAAGGGLADLDAMTFGCPKAGLNAAAREAATVPSQGTYQFAYFRIVSDSHHASYEVHFKSNYVGEPDLKYCVSVYCQQGWDPKTTKTSVTLMGDARRPGKDGVHVGACRVDPPVRRRVK